MSTENTKQIKYPIFARNFSQLIGYIKDVTRHARSAAAATLETDYENIRYWTEGEYLPKGEMLLKIKEKYNQVSIDWLLTGKGEKFFNAPGPNIEAAEWEKKYHDLSDRYIKLSDENRKLKEPWDGKDRRVTPIKKK